MSEVKIDKQMWAVRISRTRTIAAETCKKGRISINGALAKAAQTIKPGDVIQIRKLPVTYSFKVLQTIEKRAGAKLVPEMMENATTPDQYELLKTSRVSGFINRVKRTSRSTKEDRRELEDFIAPELMDDSDSDLDLEGQNTSMSEKIIKWGFIGCGEVTKYKSGPVFQKIEHSEVVVVMSQDISKAKAYAKERGIAKWYNDAQELINDEEVNVVYITTPPSSHATHAMMPMKASKPVCIEKSMVMIYEEYCHINRASQETGVPCFMVYCRHCLPYFPKVKSLAEEGVIGNIISMQIRFAQPSRDLDYNKESLPWRVQLDVISDGYLYDLAPHQVDILQDMFGYILEVNEYENNRGGLYPAEDTLSACFQFDSGLVDSDSWCFVAHESAQEDRIEIIRDKGIICFSVFTYDPIALHTEKEGEEMPVENPVYV